MAINTQTIRIDLNTGRTIPVAFAHQNDTNRQLTFQLYNNGVAFTPSSTTVKFAYKSPIVNGRYSVITGSQMASGTVSGNTVTVTLPAQYTQVSGVGLLTMILTTSGNTLRPVNIKFVCQGSADGDDSVLGASDWPEGLYDYMDNWLAENEPTEIANLKSDLTNHPETRTTKADNVDLDITDENGNVLARMSGGNIQTKNFNSADTSVIKATNSSDEVFDIADENGNVLERLVDGNIQTKNFNSKGMKLFYSGKPSNNDILLTNDDVEEGDEIVLIFTAGASAQGCFIDILNSNNQRITYIGRQSIGSEKKYIEKYIIPSGFAKAKAVAVYNEMTVFAIAPFDSFFGSNLYDIWTNSVQLSDIQHLDDAITEYRYSTQNKLANPLYTSREKYNTDNPNNQIDVELALYRGVTGNATYRIPAMCITNSGTVLVCGTHMTSAGGDFGDFSIDVARKPEGGSWSISEVVPFDSTREDYGSVLNNEFLVDRNTGRVYLFYGTEKKKIVWWDAETEDGDFRYVYSDDDGANWSSPVSMKSLWDTNAYDYCIPSCTKGITLTDGSLVVPCFAKKGTLLSADSYPLLLIKPTNGNWYFSSVASVDGIRHLDECAVVEGINENEIWLYCRPNTDYGTGVNRGYNKFVYSVTGDSFTHQSNSYFDTNRHNCFSIDRITIDNALIFLMSFTDTHRTVRENLTLWASLDGDTWIKVYKINKSESAGYSVLDNYDGQIGVAYEYVDSTYSGTIAYQNLTALKDIIFVSATQYIDRRIGVQDRMQMLFNSATGID